MKQSPDMPSFEISGFAIPDTWLWNMWETLLYFALNVSIDHKMVSPTLLCGSLLGISCFHSGDKNRSKLPKNTAAWQTTSRCINEKYQKPENETPYDCCWNVIASSDWTIGYCSAANLSFIAKHAVWVLKCHFVLFFFLQLTHSKFEILIELR